MRINLGKYEIIIQRDSRLHITPQSCEDEIEEWTLTFPIEKRISAQCDFVHYLFRDFDIAILTYPKSAALILLDVMKNLKTIRDHLKSKGATEEQLKPFDKAVHDGYNNVCQVVLNRGDQKVYKKIKCYDLGLWK